MKSLLNDISGEARDGEILAVLGASGSEKSTLIDALANRIANESLLGHESLEKCRNYYLVLDHVPDMR